MCSPLKSLQNTLAVSIIAWKSTYIEQILLLISPCLLFLDTAINPRILFVSESCVHRAWYSKDMSIQWGGYLNLAVSKRRTLSEGWWKPPIGVKCPSPVCWRVFLLKFAIKCKPYLLEEAITAVLKRSWSQRETNEALVLWCRSFEESNSS